MLLANQVFKDKEAPAIALLACATKKYGSECYDWEPELLRNIIEKDYDIQISDLQSDKLQAAINVLTLDSFETHWKVFENCCHLFCDIADTFEDLEPLEVEELIVGNAHAVLIRHEPITYDDEINAYAGLVFSDFGMTKAPTLFASAIMPKQNQESDDKEKNEALQEVFDAHVKRVVEYLESIQL